MSYLTVLRNLLAVGGAGLGGAYGGGPMLDYLRGQTPAQPAGTPAGAPASSTTTAPVTQGAASTSPPGRTGMGAPAQTQSAAAEQPTGGASTAQPSLLDRLRERMTANIEGGPLQRVGDLGAGMLASRSPNFFTMLGEGLKAQSEAERQRNQDLRQAAATEIEDLYRREQARLRELELNDPEMRDLRRAQAAELRSRIGLNTARATMDATAMRQEALMLRARQAAAAQLQREDQMFGQRPEAERAALIEERARLLLPSLANAPAGGEQQPRQNVRRIESGIE